MVIEIEINKKLREEALAHSSERIKFEFDRFKLNLEQRKNMIFIGTIGQLIFKKYLESKNTPFEFEFQAGKYDELDFKINNQIIEVKTSGFDLDWKNLNLLYSDSQFSRGIRKKYSYCIQIFINGYNKKDRKINLELCNKAIIVGGIKFEKINSFKNKRLFLGDDYKVPLNQLISIEEVIKNVLK
jgi:hypothetical protein